MTAFVGIWINCPSVEVADAIADALLEARLVACSNRHAPITSRYWWEGRLATGEEIPLLVKTRKANFDAVAAEVRKLHPYRTPSICAVELLRVNDAYADWLLNETQQP